MLRWYPSLLLQVVLELTFVPIAFFTIFVINAIADRDTPWAIGGLAGTGAQSSFWLILAILALGWTILVLGWRGAKNVFKVLLVLWHLALSISSILLALQPGNLAIRGESVGFSMSVEILGPVFFNVALICVFVWVIRDARTNSAKRTVSPFQPRNKKALICACIGLLFSSILYWQNIEQFGTIMAILTVLALHETIRPLHPGKEIHNALFMEGSGS